MPEKAPRMFTAERRLLERAKAFSSAYTAAAASAQDGPGQSGPAQDPQSSAPAMADPSGISNAEILTAITDLRRDISKLTGDQVASPEDQASRDIRIEIAQMVRMIGRAKQEIAQIKHPQADDDRMKSAGSELDAIVLATEVATHDILEAQEKVEKKINKVQELCREQPEVIALTDEMAAELITILEACNFQDITGQRINKVIKTLRFIEERILAVINVWGVQAFSDLPIPEDEMTEEEKLLNGPQLANQGINQDDIDALFD